MQIVKGTLVLFIAIFLIACAQHQDMTPHERHIQNTYNALVAAKEFRSAGLSAAGDIYRMGMMEEALKYQIIDAGNKLQTAITLSASMLQVYMSTDGANADDLAKQLMMYHEIYLEFSRLVTPLLLRGIEK